MGITVTEGWRYRGKWEIKTDISYTCNSVKLLACTLVWGEDAQVMAHKGHKFRHQGIIFKLLLTSHQKSKNITLTTVV